MDDTIGYGDWLIQQGLVKKDGGLLIPEDKQTTDMKNDEAVKKQLNAEGKTTSPHKQELQHPKGDTQPEMKPAAIDDDASNNPALPTDLAEVDT